MAFAAHGQGLRKHTEADIGGATTVSYSLILLINFYIF